MLAIRSTGLVLHAEFWAEDGWAWYPDAYNLGVSSLFVPLAGYLQTLSRLVGWMAQALPLRWAPTVFVAAALAIQALPPAFLVSNRLSGAWPSVPARLGFAVLWVALPNIQEEHANLTNAQWHLAALAFLVLLADPPRGPWGRAFDWGVLALSGLSGPCCLLLLPIAAWRGWNGKGWRGRSRLAIVAASSLVQGWTLLHTVSDRTSAPLGADPATLARVVAQQVVLAPWTGQAYMARLQAEPVWQSGWTPAIVAAGALGLAAVAFWRGPLILRAACVLGGLELGAALLRPQISKSGPQWTLMMLPGVGQRYYYLPMLAWVGVVFWLAGTRPLGARVAGLVLVAGLAFGVWADWFLPGREPTGFVARAEAFERSAPGTVAAFPVNPLFVQLPMVLTRR